MHPKMIEVVGSSNIAGVQHAGTTLLVAFHSGKTYAYDDVPREIFSAMSAAKSKGTYLNEVVKKGGFAFRQVDATELDALLTHIDITTKRRTRNTPTISVIDLIAKYPFLRQAF